MNAVLGYAQLLLRDSELDGRQRRMLEIVHSSGDHLLTIINDILEMSKIEAGRMQIVSEAFDLRSLLEDVEMMFRPLTAARGIALTFALQEGLACELASDTAKVRQVVLNLLSNATKFTQAGSIMVRASSRLLEPGHHLVMIEVEDTGVGIDARHLATIFEAFAQTEAGMRAGGTGLGLAISRSFARMLGGDITVSSVEGHGSCFSFSFAAREADSRIIACRRQPMPLGLAAANLGCKVLIVDDVATNRDLMDDLLVRMGFETRIATTGEEGIAIHDAWRPAIILMDLRMRGMGGLEAMRRLRAAGSSAMLMAVTASGIVETEAEALAMGADGFLRKPYRESDLLAKIGELLGVSYDLPRPTDEITIPQAGSGSIAQALGAPPEELVTKLRDAASKARAAHRGPVGGGRRDLASGRGGDPDVGRALSLRRALARPWRERGLSERRTYRVQHAHAPRRHAARAHVDRRQEARRECPANTISVRSTRPIGVEPRELASGERRAARER